MGLKEKLESVNGYGWLISVVVNLVALAFTAGTLYWKMHEDLAVINAKIEERTRVVEKFAMQAERTHERMWDQINSRGAK